jgi:hypothetical protein
MSAAALLSDARPTLISRCPANANSLDLILIFGVPVEECLDFQFVDPATQAVSELSLKPKVKAAKSSA